MAQGVEERHARKAAKFYLSNLPRRTALKRLVDLARSRWAIEQSYEHLKDELALDRTPKVTEPRGSGSRSAGIGDFSALRRAAATGRRLGSRVEGVALVGTAATGRRG